MVDLSSSLCGCLPEGIFGISLGHGNFMGIYEVFWAGYPKILRIYVFGQVVNIIYHGNR